MSELNPIPFVIALGVLVTLHELGHFTVAKLCGVRVLKFSIGFGNPIGFGRYRLRWLRNGTEYVVAWIPLGGFVKMLGENPGEEDAPATRADREHSLPAQPLWKKLAIVLAGPLVNLALPVFYFLAMLWIGVSQPAPVIGSVERGSPAEAADIRAGDRVLAVNGAPVKSWRALDSAVVTQPGATLQLTLERGGEPLERTLEAQRRPGLDELSQPGEVGWIGLLHERQQARVAAPDARSIAIARGLRSGDLISRVAGSPVSDWSELAAAYGRATGGDVALTVQRGERQLEIAVPALGELDALGVLPLAFSVAEVTAGSAAAKAGLARGDVIVSLDGRPLGSFQSFYETVRASGGRALEISYARGGEMRHATIVPTLVKGEPHEGGGEVYRAGLGPENALLPGAFEELRMRNPLRSVPAALAMTARATAQILEGMRRLFVGRISLDAIGGPIAIASQSKQAWERGLDSFVQLVIFLSINLGILNLLPIPILDGGQAVMLTVEAALRDRFTLRAREVAQTLGFALLLALMGVAFYNDITNYVVDFVRNL